MSKKHFIDAAKKMPPLDHHPLRPAQWKAENSELVRWFQATLAGIIYLVETAQKDAAIVFDPASKTWRGAEYLPPGGKSKPR